MVGSYAATAGKAMPVFAPPLRLVKRLRLIWQHKEPALSSGGHCKAKRPATSGSTRTARKVDMSYFISSAARFVAQGLVKGLS